MQPFAIPHNRWQSSNFESLPDIPTASTFPVFHRQQRPRGQIVELYPTTIPPKALFDAGEGFEGGRAGAGPIGGVGARLI